MKFNYPSVAATRDWLLLSLFPVFGQTKAQVPFWQRGGLGSGPSCRYRSRRPGTSPVPVALQVVFTLGFLLLPMRLMGQVPTRAELLEQERAGRIPEATPPQRTNIERGMMIIQKALERFNSVRGDENGLHYSSGHFPAGAGFGFGLGYSHTGKWVDGYAEPDRPNRLDFHWNAAYSTRDYYETAGGIELLHIAGGIFNVGLRGKYFEDPEDDFFGIGPDTHRKDRTNYLYRSLEGGGDAWLSPIRGFRAGGGVSYLSPSVGSGRDPRFASLEQVFDPSTVPGFGERLPDFLRVDAFVDYDRRDNPLYPRAGNYFGARFSNFRDRHLDRYHFRRWEFDAQQYLPFDDGYKVLALRGNVVMTDAGTNDAVPFIYMPDLGGAQRLRGFREFRFRDRNSVLATVEYRWEAWWALDMALFVDGGKVAARRSDIDLSGWEGSYGLGLRFHSKKAFTFRLDLAFSREGFIPLFRAEHTF